MKVRSHIARWLAVGGLCVSLLGAGTVSAVQARPHHDNDRYNRDYRRDRGDEYYESRQNRRRHYRHGHAYGTYRNGPTWDHAGADRWRDNHNRSREHNHKRDRDRDRDRDRR